MPLSPTSHSSAIKKRMSQSSEKMSYLLSALMTEMNLDIQYKLFGVFLDDRSKN